MDYSLDFKIGADGEHYFLYYEAKIIVPRPNKCLAEMNREEYSDYFYNVACPVVWASAAYWRVKSEMIPTERFTLD